MGEKNAGKEEEEKVTVEVYRTFLGNSWNEKGELKGRFAAGRVLDLPSQGAAAEGDGAGGAPEKGRRGAGEQELRIELELLGRREYYTAREGCKFFFSFR